MENLLSFDHEWHFYILHVQFIASLCVSNGRWEFYHLDEEGEYVEDICNEGVGHVFLSTYDLPRKLQIFPRRDNVRDFDKKLEYEWIRRGVVDIHLYLEATEHQHIGYEGKEVI